MRALSFTGCFGLLHGQGPAARAALICAPLGYEELCSHRSLYQLAERLGEQGVPTLRFDYQGTGDSVDPEGGPRLADWQAGLNQAIESLKAATGADRIILIGLRFGALMALGAAGRDDVESLVLLTPPASGRQHMRELKLLARIVGPFPTDADFDGLELGGDRFPRALVEDISAFDPVSTLASSARVLIAGPESLAPFEALAATLTSRGLSTTCRDFSGYGRMMCDPTASIVPEDALAGFAEWIGPGETGENAPQVSDSTSIAGQGWREEALFLDHDMGLFGILTWPMGQPVKRAAMLLNTGAIHHIGWGRMSVELARSLARDGVAVLRLDIGGFGDSAARDRSGDVPLYDMEAGADIQVARQALAERGLNDVTLIGHCAGAFQAFHASEAANISGLVLTNQLCYLWGPSYRLQLSAWANAREVSMAQGAAEATGDASFARRLFGTALSLAKWGFRNSIAGARRAQQIARRITGFNPVLARLKRLTGAGARVMLVNSAGDASEQEAERYGGPGGRDFAAIKGVSLVTLPQTDHTISHRAARQAYFSALRAFLVQ